MRKITLLLTLVACLGGLPRAYSAAYITPAEEKEQANQREREQAKQKLAAYVGKTFWVVPNPKAINRLPFYKEIPARITHEELFHPTEVSKFTVMDYVTIEKYPDSPDLNDHYLKIQFEDGMEGFLKLELNYSSDFYRGGPRYDFMEYIYSENPANIDKRQAKQRAEAKVAAKARVARGGVRIGMSKNEVLRSNWGRPQEINRTTTVGGVHEQWVYGGRNYLYFDNGILTGIQN